GKNSVSIAQENPTIRKIENRYAYDAIESVRDFIDARLELFPKQITVIRRGFGFLLLTDSTRTQSQRSAEREQPPKSRFANQRRDLCGKSLDGYFQWLKNPASHSGQLIS